MRKIFFILFLLLTLVAFFLWSRIVYSVRSNDEFSEAEVDNLKGIEVEMNNLKGIEVEEEVSENDSSQRNKMNLELKKFFQEQDALLESSNAKYENLVKTLNNYIQRYISLFLITSNLVEHQVKDSNEEIKIDLEITITGEDLAYLQGFSKSAKESAQIRNLSKLDAIFSKIARLKQRTYAENAVRYSKSFLSSLIFRVFNNTIFNDYLSLLIIFALIYLFYTFALFNTFKLAMIIINSLIIWDSLNLYWKRLKEVSVGINVKAMQFKNMPKDCDPANLNWYQRMLNFGFQSHCVQYFENLHKNPLEEVSIAQCVIDTYCSYLIRTPIKILGTSIRDFTGEITELWPWPVKYIISIPLIVLFVIIAAVIILILCGKRLRLSFFGAAMEVGDAKPLTVADKEKPAAVTGDSVSALKWKEDRKDMVNGWVFQATRGVRDLRKLRPWTHARFPRHLERDLRWRGRSLLRALRCTVEMPGDVIKNASEFNEKLNGQNSNVVQKDNIIEQD